MLGLRTTIYKVPELAAAKSWYAEVFRTQPYFDEPFYVGFEIGGFELGLVPDVPTAIGDNVMSYWGVEDTAAEFERCVELGATAYRMSCVFRGSKELISQLFNTVISYSS